MATPIAWGFEFLVNTLTQGAQSGPDMALLPDGSFVVVWAQNYLDDRGGIRGQIHYADGTKKGGEFQIAPDAVGAEDMGSSSITVLRDGRFVVTWMDDSRRPGDSGTEIRARIYSASGEAQGGDFLVNNTLSGYQYEPQVTALDNGGFVVAFRGRVGTSPHVLTQAFDASGVRLGGETPVPTASTGAAMPSVVALTNGRYGVFYQGVHPDDPSGQSILGRILTADGQTVPGSGEVLVASTRTGDQKLSSAALLRDGRIVVVWQHDHAATGDGSASTIMGRILNPDGTPSTGEFRVNVVSQGSQAAPAVTALADGGFAVAFQGPDPDGRSDIRLVTFGSDAQRRGDEIRVNQATHLDQIEVSLVELADGRIVVGWTDVSSLHFDDRDGSVRAQIVDPRDRGQVFAGTAGSDQFAGTVYGDMLAGGAGSDRLWGYRGDDTLEGGAGADTLDGGDGFDFTSFASASVGITASLSGGFGDAQGDVLIGIEGIIGSAHADTLTGNGRAALRGGFGNDTYRVEGNDRVVELAGGGTDTVLVSASYSLASDAVVEVLATTAIKGTAMLSLEGSDSANTITGNAGRNTIQGGGGNDRIYGNLGNDLLFGGAGRDIFAFDTKPHKSRNVDAVSDYVVKDDTIWLENKIFKALGKKGSEKKPLKLSADAFTTGWKAADAEDRIIYDRKSGGLWYDPDGTGGASPVLIAVLPKKLKMSAADFFVI